MKTGKIAFGAMEEVVYGLPAGKAVAEQADRLASKRVLLLVSGTLDRTTGEIEKIRSALGSRCAGTFAAMPAHTPRAAVVAATAQAREANADLIVTVGGGSVIDAGKAVQLCLSNDIRTPEAIDKLKVTRAPDGTPIIPAMNAPSVPQIAVATTISGGEFSAIIGVTDERTKSKDLLRHPLVMPRAVVLDPAITVHTPEWLWLSTGVRAVDHCVEGICSLESNPYGDAQAIKGLAMLAQALPRVKAEPRDLDARLDCQIGTWLSMGPLASGVPMGASHGIGYVLGAMFGVPHGHTSCLMLPSVMRWNLSANADRQRLVALAMGKGSMQAADALAALIGDLGMPVRLNQVNVGPEHFEKIAAQAMGTPWVPRNPRRIEGPAQVREILELAA